MKRIYCLLLVLLVVGIFGLQLMSQENCKVLKAEIDSAYMGACKRDLAHGVGEAWGMDHYFGEFKKGLPHGKGTYEYFEGSVYTGAYFKGLRHGEGEFVTIINGQDSTMAGMWDNDEYLGQMPKGGGYNIIRRLNVERYKVYREGEGSKIIYKLNSTTMETEVVISGSTGNQFTYAGYHGYEDIHFPFNGQIRYFKLNKLRTALHEVRFEIEITLPGIWIVELH